MSKASALLEAALAAYARQDLQHSESLFRQVLLCDPRSRIAQSYVLQLAFYSNALFSAQRVAAHVAWGKQFLPEPVSVPPHSPLRIGYVSSSFNKGPNATFLQPILRSHDRSKFAVFCYASMDSTGVAGAEFRDVSSMDPDQTLNLIRADEIDLLVNTDGHADAENMEVFARRAAPVQVSLPIYPGTTGLTTVQCRFADKFTDPPGRSEHQYTEQLLYLPAFLPFDVQSQIAIERSPFERHGFLTFGVFANPIKIRQECLSLWADVLRRAPQARLVFHHPLLAGDRHPGRHVVDPAILHRLSQPFLAAGISSDRLAFVGGLEWRDHMDFHNEVDLLLDSLPYSGCTTTVEALFMGVPTLTVEGSCFVERTTHALLKHVGLDEFSTQSKRDLEDTALLLARFPAKVAEVRSSLRQRLQASPLMDVPNWVRALESAYLTLLSRADSTHNEAEALSERPV